MKRKLILIGVLSFFPIKEALSQENLSFYLVEKELQVISATKEYVSYLSVPRYMKVINREELDRWGVRNLFDLLKFLPEFYPRKSYFYYNAVGALGIRQSYFSEKVQVLIDGVPIMDPSTGSSFSTNNNISLDNVKRVEIVYGPMTTLYGLNSSLAVINLVTYDGVEFKGKLGSYLRTDGSNDSYFIKAIESKGWGGIFSLNYNEEKGPYKEYEDIYKIFKTDYSIYNKHFTYYLKLKNEKGFYFNLYGVNRDTTFPLTISGVISHGNHSFADRKAYLNRFGFERELGFGKLNLYGFFNHFYLKRGYNLCPKEYSLCSSINKDGLIATEKRFVNSYGSGGEFHFNLLDGKATAGVELSKVSMYKTTLSANFLPASIKEALYLHDPSKVVIFSWRELSDKDKILDEASRVVVSPYLQYFYSKEDYSFLFNLRWDRASDVGDTASYSFSGMVKLFDRGRLKLNLGKSVRVPSFEEKHIKNNPVLIGNSNLTFEKVYSIMPSFEYLGDDFKLSSLFYLLYVRDMIYKKRVSLAESKWDNAPGTVRVRGMTFSFSKSLYEGKLYMNLGRRFSFKGLEDSEFSSFPKWKGVLGYSFCLNGFTFDFNGEGVSKVGVAPGYMLFNSSFSYTFSNGVKFNLKLENLFDREVYYATPAGEIKGEGRSLWVGLDFIF